MTYADPQTAVALLDRDGRELKGNLAAVPQPSLPSLQEGYRNALVRLRGQTTPREAALVAHRLPNGQWLVSGRIAGEGLAIRETLERSLLIALIVAGLLGLLCGVILAHYVGASDRRHRGGRQPHQRSRPQQRVPLSARRRCVRPARPADQRHARPHQRADGGTAAA